MPNRNLCLISLWECSQEFTTPQLVRRCRREARAETSHAPDERGAKLDTTRVTRPNSNKFLSLISEVCGRDPLASLVRVANISHRAREKLPLHPSESVRPPTAAASGSRAQSAARRQINPSPSLPATSCMCEGGGQQITHSNFFASITFLRHFSTTKNGQSFFPPRQRASHCAALPAICRRPRRSRVSSVDSCPPIYPFGIFSSTLYLCAFGSAVFWHNPRKLQQATRCDQVEIEEE